MFDGEWRKVPNPFPRSGEAGALKRSPAVASVAWGEGDTRNGRAAGAPGGRKQIPSSLLTPGAWSVIVGDMTTTQEAGTMTTTTTADSYTLRIYRGEAADLTWVADETLVLGEDYEASDTADQVAGWMAEACAQNIEAQADDDDHGVVVVELLDGAGDELATARHSF
jgi:hypothetical protein